MITPYDVKEFYAGVNGDAAAADVPLRCYQAAAHYGNLNEYPDAEDVAQALDVFRLIDGDEFLEEGFYRTVR